MIWAHNWKKNTKESAEKLIKTKREVNKIMRYKINVKKLIVFIRPTNDWLERVR